ncbi:MAG TPA: anti-sigma factor, partial [Bacteroidia bacterium]|nr:anti-sigma factor [Bacteroidia bacterium]
MEIQAYIASGIIERYVLGDCTPSETEELEVLAKQFPEIRAELDAISTSLESYAFAYAQNPPSKAREQILNAVRKEDRSHPSQSKITTLPVTPPKMVTGWLSYAAAALFALLVGSILLNYIFYRQWKTTAQELAQVSAGKLQVANEFRVEKTRYLQTLKDLDILRNPALVKMEMKGMKPAPDAKALVFMNPVSNEIYLDVKMLPAPADSMQYQFWAIVDG